MTPPSHGVWPCTNAEYHADRTADSFSTLKLFAESPARYRAIREGLPPDRPTDDQRFGNLVHAMVLEPETVAQRYVRRVKFDRRFKDQKAAALVWEASIGDVEAFDDDEFDRAVAMRNAVRRHPKVAEWFAEECVFEEAVRWTDGVPLKARPDAWIPSLNLVVDLKTIADADMSAERLLRAIEHWRYFAQAAMYLDGVAAVRGCNPRFAWVFVSKKPPHEVAVLTMPYGDFDLGRALYRSWVGDLAAAVEAKNFGRPGNAEVQVVTLSDWVRNRIEEKVYT